MHHRGEIRTSDAFDFRHPDNYPFYASDTMERMDWPLLGPMSLRTAVIYNEPEEAVEFIWAKGPVVYMFGSLEMLQQVMRLAEAENMTNGDYVFFYLDLFEESLKAEGHREAAKPWQSKEGQDGGGLREAFQTVLVITSYALQTREYQRFHSEVLLRAQKDHGVVLNVSLGQNLLAACYHDVLLLYIRALNETLREGGTKRDTSRILEKMKDLKIQGVTGTVSISSENIRKMDFAIWTMADVESGEYQVVGHYVASEKQIQWMGPIHWKKGGPPLDNFSSVSDMNDTSYAPPKASSEDDSSGEEGREESELGPGEGTSRSSPAPAGTRGPVHGPASTEGLTFDNCFLIMRDLQWRVASMEAAHKRFEATLNELREGQERMEAALNSLKCFCMERLGPMGAAVLGDQP
ncbi:atrial natriuretic peptide receptor 2-like [Sphaerodactylus townsendi]|uniref:atrial natriuretic peptide receptor 2-like n=1 Tax=Sphaerodactylus townsendi TaxID=933632 RepID=UPI002026956A|nr:atrial natriuretic peptide receptor 2-like [Sphaerodactylus townsendi]